MTFLRFRLPVILIWCVLVLPGSLFAAEPPAKDPVVLILGDSLTAGYGLQEQEAYPQLVQKHFDDEEIKARVVNAGLSGDTIAGGLDRLPWLLQQKPNWVAVALGANDGLRGFPVAKSEEKLREVIQVIREHKARPLLFGMDLPTNYGDEYRENFKAMYQRVADDLKVPLLPFLLENVAMVKELNQADGIHPNREGQVLVARNVIAFLQPIVTGEHDGLPRSETAADNGDPTESDNGSSTGVGNE